MLGATGLCCCSQLLFKASSKSVFATAALHVPLSLTRAAGLWHKMNIVRVMPALQGMKLWSRRRCWMSRAQSQRA